jgi:transcriptional antiterminator NusG
MEKDKNNKKGLQVDDTIKSLRAWYAVHTYSGYEDAVERYLKQRVESLSMNDKIFNVVVPKEKKIAIKNGKRKVTEEKIYPGYVLVEMILNEDSWYVVRNTPRVMGFVGPDPTKPTPVSKSEVEYLLSRMEEDQEAKFKVEYAIGDLVRVVDGPFRDSEGKIIGIDEEHGRVRVSIPVFGRDTELEIDSLQIQKI